MSADSKLRCEGCSGECDMAFGTTGLFLEALSFTGSASQDELMQTEGGRILSQVLSLEGSEPGSQESMDSIKVFRDQALERLTGQLSEIGCGFNTEEIEVRLNQEIELGD